LDFHCGRGQPKLVKNPNAWDDDEELSDHVMARLAQIRAKALEIHSKRKG
jgi:hypothetical protein